MKSSRLLLLPCVLLWLAGVLTPLIFLLRISLYSRGPSGEAQFDALFYQAGTWSLQSFQRVLADPFYHRLFGFTALLAIVVTAATLLPGYLLGYAVYRAGPRTKIALILLIVLPKFTNILVFVYGVKIIFGANGFWPVVAGEVLLLIPYAALTIAAGLDSAVPWHIVEAARGLGASAAAAFWNVTLPLSFPSLATAAMLTILWSASAFLGPFLLGEPAQYTISVEVERQVHQDLDWTLAAALNIVLIAVLTASSYAVSFVRRRLA